MPNGSHAAEPDSAPEPEPAAEPEPAPARAPADRSIFDSAHDAFVAMDRDGLITAWNPAAEATFGWTRDEAIGRSVAETIIPDELPGCPPGGAWSATCRAARPRCSTGASRCRRSTATVTSSRSR